MRPVFIHHTKHVIATERSEDVIFADIQSDHCILSLIRALKVQCPFETWMDALFLSCSRDSERVSKHLPINSYHREYYQDLYLR